MSVITKISNQKKNKDRYNIFLDGKYSFPVSEKVLLDHKLTKDQDLDDVLIREIIQDENYEKIYNKILNFLSYRIRTRKEVIDRLKEYLYKGGIDTALTGEFEAKILDSLERLKLLDDNEFASNYVEISASLKTPPGRRKMKEFMMKRGVNYDLIEDALNEYSSEAEQKGAQKLMEKKMKSLKGEKDYKAKQKIWKFLAGRGYSPNVIEAVVDSNFEVY
jgi:regulatory protein